MKRKNLIAWLVALALLLSGTALAAEKELVVYSEEDLAVPRSIPTRWILGKTL